jgi:hypothetical protein
MLPERTSAQTQNIRVSQFLIAFLLVAVLVGMLMRLDMSFAPDDGSVRSQTIHLKRHPLVQLASQIRIDDAPL